MNIKRIFTFIIIIAFLFTYYYVLGSQKICVKVNINGAYVVIKQKFTNLFCNIFTVDGQIEYEGKDFIILGGNTILMPNKGEGINIQCYLKDNETSCELILAYPALPLESY